MPFTIRTFRPLHRARARGLPLLLGSLVLVPTLVFAQTGGQDQRHGPEGLVAQPAAPGDQVAPGDQATAGDDMIDAAEDLVRALYEMHTRSFTGAGPGPLDPDHAGRFFAADVVAVLRANPLQADPLFNAQDFDGSVAAPYRDPQQPMFRGMITVLVDFINFGQPQQAVVRLRADTATPGSPVRIMRIEHDGWSFP